MTGPDSYLSNPCTGPVDLPDRALTQLEIEKLWGKDRLSLVDCGARKDGLHEFYVERDNGLTDG